MTVRAYLRVSTVEQSHSGLGLAAQRETIQVEAGRRGWSDIAWYEDAGISGRSLARPDVARLLEDLRRDDVLVVSKLDRLSRSLMDAVGLLDAAKRRGFVLIALDLGVDTSTPTGRLVASVMAAVASWEREIIGQRTSEAMQAAKAAGRRFGRPSQIPDGTMERIECERADGHTYAAIAASLNEGGVPTPQGGRWWPSSVRGALLCRENDRLAGLLADAHPAAGRDL